MNSDPRPITADLLGKRFQFQTAQGLFSADRVDDGTRLLLDHLPPRPPQWLLDMGCGYGALGLPVAARHPEARCVLVDCLTPAVQWAQHNAQTHGLTNVEVRPSLGYRDLSGQTFDWILCNVPARIGDPALEYLLGEGAQRLTPDGQLRVVVIRDLGPRVEMISARRGWPVQRCGEGARHVVFSLAALPTLHEPVDHESIYLRDSVEQLGLSFQRPYDISEDPSHVAQGLPLLLELLPRVAAGEVAVWRGGYGATAVVLAMRGGNVRIADPDLLATAFARRNGAQHRVGLKTTEAPTLELALEPAHRFDLIVGELSTTLDVATAAADLATSVERLRPGGQALWLGPARWGQRLLSDRLPLAKRGSFAVWRLTSPTKRAGKRPAED